MSINKLDKVYEILISKRKEMETFYDHYVFKKMGINKNEFIDNETQFLLFIDFSLNTRMKIVNKDISEGKKYFKMLYKEIVKTIKQEDVDTLKTIMYNAPGVGQKIGSMILEIIFLYSNYKDDKIAKSLFVPIDTHIERIFKDSFGVNVPKISSNYRNESFVEFQLSLDKFTNNRSRLFFDYLWFIGKMFCSKITDEKSKGYKLCNYCWIRDYCQNEKWV